MMRAGSGVAAPVTIRFTAGGLWREGAGDKQDLYPGERRAGEEFN